jgi:PilZ domain
MQERRQSVRQTKDLHSRIYFNNGRDSVPCLILDASYEGARIVITDPIDVPDEIELFIPGRDRIARGSVRWRHGGTLGLALSEIARYVPSSSRRHPHAHRRHR